MNGQGSQRGSGSGGSGSGPASLAAAFRPEQPPSLFENPESGAGQEFPWGPGVGDQGAKDFGQKVESSGATLKERAASLPHMRDRDSHEPSAASLTLQDNSVAIRFQDMANPRPDIMEFPLLAPSMTVQQIVQILDTNNGSLEVKLRRAASGVEKQDLTNLQKAILGYVAVAPALSAAHPQAWPDIAAKLLDHVVMYDRLAQIFVQDNPSQGTAYPQPLYQMFLQFMTLAGADVPLIRNALSATHFLRQRLHFLCIDYPYENAYILDELKKYDDFTCEAHVQEKTAHILKYCGVTQDHFLRRTDITEDDDLKLNADLEKILNFLEKLSPYLDREHRFLHSSINGTKPLADQILQVVGAYDTLLDIAERVRRKDMMSYAPSGEDKGQSIEIHKEIARLNNLRKLICYFVFSRDEKRVHEAMPCLGAYLSSLENVGVQSPQTIFNGLAIFEATPSEGKPLPLPTEKERLGKFLSELGHRYKNAQEMVENNPDNPYLLALLYKDTFITPCESAHAFLEVIDSLLADESLPENEKKACFTAQRSLRKLLNFLPPLTEAADKILINHGFRKDPDSPTRWIAPERLNSGLLQSLLGAVRGITSPLFDASERYPAAPCPEQPPHP